MWPISSCLTSGGRVPDQGNSGERELPNIFDTDDLIDEFDRDDDARWESLSEHDPYA